MQKTRLPKLNKCMGGDPIRPNLMHMYVSKDVTVVTDAHCLVEHNTRELFGDDFTDSLEEPILIHLENVKELTKTTYDYRVLLWDEGKIQLIHRNGHSIYIPFSLESEQEKPFPDYKKVFPVDGQGVSEIGVNPTLYQNVYEALGKPLSGLKLCFYGKTKAIMAYPNGSDYEFSKALIMPSLIS